MIRYEKYVDVMRIQLIISYALPALEFSAPKKAFGDQSCRPSKMVT